MSRTQHAILTLDLGTSGAKVALCTSRGDVLGWEFEPVPLLLTQDGGAEQEPEAWWRAFVTATQRLVGRRIVPAHSIRALCCSAQGEGTVPVDASGQPLMNAILWMDMRGAAHLKRQMRGLVNFQGMSVVKALRWLRLTGGMPSATGKDPASHMLLVRDVHPGIYERTHKFLTVLDYMNLRLTGVYVSTFDSILTSWVTDNRDPDRIRYHPTLVANSGIEREKFPDIVPCTQVLGPVRGEVAEALGLSHDVQVVAGAIDNTAAAIGSGAVEDRIPHLYLGTSSWVAAHVPYKRTDVRAAIASVPCALRGRYLMTALQASAGANLTLLQDGLAHTPAPDELPGTNLRGYAAMDELASHAPAGSQGLIYTPWPWGERAPVDDPSLRAGFYNLTLRSTRADVARAVLEGVALNTRWLMKPVERFLGERPSALHVVGGGANSEIWCQILADVLALDIKQVADPIQANARGAALIASAGLGELELRSAGEHVAIRRTYAPDPRNRAIYDAKFDAFVEIYGRMKGLYKKLNAGTVAHQPVRLPEATLTSEVRS
jgi:xylulokinase